MLQERNGGWSGPSGVRWACALLVISAVSCGGVVRSGSGGRGAGTANGGGVVGGNANDGGLAVGGHAFGGNTNRGGRAVGGAGVGGAGGDTYANLTGCVLDELVVIPSELSPTDGCEATYVCDGDAVLFVECDGENDGTNTSLCSCNVGSKSANWKDGGLVAGEGEEACLAGYANCSPAE